MSDDARAAARHQAALGELRTLRSRGATRAELTILLAAQGYDGEHAEALLRELDASDATADRSFDAGDAPSSAEPPPRESGSPTQSIAPAVRVWAAFERARFAPDAWGELLRRRGDGLAEHEFEHLVDRALLQIEGPISLADLRALLGDALGPVETAPVTVH